MAGDGPPEHLARRHQDGVERPLGDVLDRDQAPAGVEEQDLEVLDRVHTVLLRIPALFGHRFRLYPDRVPADVGQRSGVCQTGFRGVRTVPCRPEWGGTVAEKLAIAA
jgi:hypothetical protein